MTDNANTDDGQSTTGTEPGTQTPDMDTALAEFNARPTDETAKRLEKIEQVLIPVAQDAALRQAETAKQTRKTAISEVVADMKKADELKDTPDAQMEGFIYRRAVESPEFGDTFDQREKNPQAWQKAFEDAQQAAIQETTATPDSKITADMDAARSAVRGDTSEPVTPDVPTPEEKASWPQPKWDQYMQGQERQSKG